MALASLVQAVHNNKVKADDMVMLNITGGGEKEFQEAHRLHYLEPTHIFPIGFTKEEVAKVAAGLEK